MLRTDRQAKDYQQAGAFHTLLGPHAAVGSQAFLCKGGQLLSVVRVTGIDAACWDPSQTDQASRLWEKAIKSLPESFRFYQFLFKRNAPPIPHRSYPDPVVRKATKARLAHLQSQAHDLYSFEFYVVLSYEGWGHAQTFFNRLQQTITSPQSLRAWFSSGHSLQMLDSELEGALQILDTKTDAFLTQLQDVCVAERLDTETAFRSLLCPLLNYAPHKVESASLTAGRFVDDQMCRSSLECYRDHLQLDNYRVQVLSLKEPPAHTFPRMFAGLLKIPCCSITALEWKRVDNARMQRLIHGQRRHHWNKRASLLNFVGDKTPQHEDLLIDDSSVAHAADLGQCLHAIEVEGHHFGEVSLTVVLYDEDDSRVRRATAEAVRVISTQGASVIEERYNLPNAWLSVIPGNPAYNYRRLYLLDTNHADLSLLFVPGVGEPWNQQLDDEYLAVFETEQKTPYFFNLHDHDTAHTLVFGRTGSGKSFLLNFLLTNLQKYTPYTVIFDLGGSYEGVTRLFGGSYLRIGVEKPSFTINPFSLAPTPENLQFLTSFVRVLIESSGETLHHQDEKDLFEQITNLYEIDPEQRRLLTLANTLNRKLRQALGKWVEGGQYGTLFDHAVDTLTIARFQTFEFEGMNEYPQVLEPLLFYVLHRASAVIYDPAQLLTFKAFVVDEAWRFFKNETICAYLTEAVKTWRKKNAALLVATQSFDDLAQSRLLDVLVESCATKLFLSNPDMNQEAYRQSFHLSQTEAHLVSQLVPKKEVLVKTPSGAAVLRLHVDPLSYWLYTNNPQDNHRKQEAFAAYGLEQGLEYLARSARP